MIQADGPKEPESLATITFGVSLPVENTEFDRLKEVSRVCEKLQYNSLWCYDHFFPYDGTDPQKPFYECLTTLAALCTVTEKIRLGSLVLCNSFRSPALVAKMTSQIDVMSNGRLEFGIGAGWFKDEFAAYGYEFPETKVRLDQLEEGIQLIKKMWVEESPSFHGKHYHATNAVNMPKPIQKPHPPIWIGGSLNRILNMVARYADGWNLGFYESNTPEGFARKNRILNAMCKNYRRDPSEIRRSWQGLLILGENESDLSRKTEQYTHLAMGYPPILATVENCDRQLRKFTDAGVTDFIIRFPDPLDFSTLEAFAELVIPRVRTRT
jgi:F420-dependent oxidoreductase-like protein